MQLWVAAGLGQYRSRSPGRRRRSPGICYGVLPNCRPRLHADQHMPSPPGSMRDGDKGDEGWPEKIFEPSRTIHSSLSLLLVILYFDNGLPDIEFESSMYGNRKSSGNVRGLPLALVWAGRKCMRRRQDIHGTYSPTIPPARSF